MLPSNSYAERLATILCVLSSQQKKSVNAIHQQIIERGFAVSLRQTQRDLASLGRFVIADNKKPCGYLLNQVFFTPA